MPNHGIRPDGAFACDLRNDEAATAFLRRTSWKAEVSLLHPAAALHALLKFTTPIRPAAARANEAMQEHDHAPLRDAIAAWCDRVR